MVRSRPHRTAFLGTFALIVALLPALAAPAAAACPPFKFIGVHGTGEGPGEGDTVGAIRAKYAALIGAANVANDPATYPRFDLFELVGKELPKVNSKVSQGESAIAQRMPNPACPDQRFILVGYSAGAWAIDKFLRAMPDEFLRVYVAGVFLMGDPVMPGTGIARGLLPLTKDQYVPKAIADRFQSVCISYQVRDSHGKQRTAFDPICSIPPTTIDLDNCIASVSVAPGAVCPHFSYKNLAADRGAQFLASVSRSPAR